MSGRLDDVAAGLDDVTDWLDAIERVQRIESLSRWIRHAPLHTDPLVSVVLPAVDRPQLLRRALESVAAQRYERFEVLVVDDGGDEDSRAVVEEFCDSRIRWSRIPRGGVCAARNAALASARGEIVAYLDDDNVMDPDWLYAVVCAFDQRPDVDVLYGAIVVDDLLRLTGESHGELPKTFLQPWDREANIEPDMGAIAHRNGLPDARFDETLSYHGDGDLLRRLTAHRDPLVLPMVACYYATDAPNRISVRARKSVEDEGTSAPVH
jgi:glycosyltransferase involved in cell wall biosynthesis